MTGKNVSFSNYPGGFSGGLTVRDVPLSVSNPGKVFWVAKGGDALGTVAALKGRKGASDGNNGSFNAPFQSLDYAMSQCLADRGDTVYVLPGYIDGISAASAIDVDVDGVTILGLGAGDKQPLIRFDDAAATFEINADNVTVEGLNFAASVTVVAKGVDIKDGSDDFKIANCRFTSDGAGFEFEDALFIITSDRGVVENNSFIMPSGGDADSAIHLNGAALGVTIRNNYVEGDYTVACVEGEGTLSQMVVIDGNTLINGVTGGLNTVGCISLLTNTTGVIQNNSLYTAVTAPAGAAISADACFYINNSISTTVASPEIPHAGGANVNAMEVTAVAVELTEAAETTALAVCDGPVDIHGILGVLSEPADASQAFLIALESGQTLWGSAEIAAANAVGDRIFSTTVGGNTTVAEVTAVEVSYLWTSPLRVNGTEDKLDFVTTNGGEGHCVFYTFWSPADKTATTEVDAS